jgi:hypothetical protein
MHGQYAIIIEWVYERASYEEYPFSSSDLRTPKTLVGAFAQSSKDWSYILSSFKNVELGWSRATKEGIGLVSFRYRIKLPV